MLTTIESFTIFPDEQRITCVARLTIGQANFTVNLFGVFDEKATEERRNCMPAFAPPASAETKKKAIKIARKIAEADTAKPPEEVEESWQASIVAALQANVGTAFTKAELCDLVLLRRYQTNMHDKRKERAYRYRTFIDALQKCVSQRAVRAIDDNGLSKITAWPAVSSKEQKA